jgi:uncharacterized protein YbbK (DUF523 family)
MKIFVSACLLGENCKYNGGNNYNEKVAELVRGHEVVALCPEVAGGLPVPRASAEIVDGVVKTKTGQSVDWEFRAGAQKVTEEAVKQKVELAVLQSRSPSCGVNEIYDGSFSGKKMKGQGVFARMLAEQGIRIIDAEDVI